MRTRKTPDTDTFYPVYNLNISANKISFNNFTPMINIEGIKKLYFPYNLFYYNMGQVSLQSRTVFKYFEIGKVSLKTGTTFHYYEKRRLLLQNIKAGYFLLQSKEGGC